MYRIGLFIGLSLGFVLTLSAQNMVYLIHSNSLEFDDQRLPNAQILRGDVIFRHDSALMYCDSAYFFNEKNSLHAFGHVRFVQGDTLFGYGDALYYDGNTKIARIRDNVKLVHFETVLTTDSMNYNRNANLAYYFGSGKIVDNLNTLFSNWGQYSPQTNQAEFRDSVHLTNPKFTLSSDTLKYNTESHIADIVSPTTIIYEQSTTIMSRSGQYNTENEQSKLYQRSLITHEDGKQLTGDTIFYDKQLGFGRILGGLEMRDTVQKVTLYGNYGELYELDSRGFVTDSALVVDWSDSTDCGYMHADTLFTEDIHYTFPNSTGIDTIYKQIRAHHNVRIYRSDMQAVCDSMVFNGRDSIMSLYTDPICWNENNQISADFIEVFTKDGSVDRFHGIGSALTVKKENSDYFNQMNGKEITAYIRDGKLAQVDVNGNAETIFYPKEDENGNFIGMNRTISSRIQIYFNDEKIDHVLFTTETNGTMYPLNQVPNGEDKLSTYFWATQERPLKPGDVFSRPTRTTRPVGSSISAIEEATGDTNKRSIDRQIGNKNKRKR